MVIIIEVNIKLNISNNSNISIILVDGVLIIAFIKEFKINIVIFITLNS